MHFQDEAVAFAHLTLPPDTFAEEATALSTKLQSLGPDYAKHRITYLTGQSDLLLELRVRDLRFAFKLDYNSQAAGTNWLFAIPFAYGRGDGVSPSTLALTYVIHLRVNRDLYRTFGADVDSEIVAGIVAAAQGEMNAEVLAGFGWSDLIVRGTFADIDAFVAFVKAIQSMRFRRADDREVFRRALTLLGYDYGEDLTKHSNMLVFPAILGRCLPGATKQAAAALEWQGARWKTFALDGKWDVLLVLDSLQGVPANDYLQHHKQLVVTGGGLRRAGIERVETHLLALRPDTMSADGMHTKDVDPRPCSCSAAVRSERQLLGDAGDPQSSAAILPSALVTSIRNVLNLFHAASNESTNCCDIVPSLVRCEIGLDRLLTHHRSLYTRMNAVASLGASAPPETPQPAAWWNAFVVKTRMDIEEWCTYAERIVSQRTVGRFEEFLAQNERVVSYRGGVQKLLYLADALLNSYAQRVFSEGEEPAFMSLYDPIDTVQSMRVVGFVRVPARYIFLLPLAIAHLWHEVGVHRFYARYWMPFTSQTRKRLMEFSDVSGDRVHSRITDLMLDLHDAYGDAVTLTKGFAANFTNFAVSLASTLFESSGFRSSPAPVKATSLVSLLVRLYLAHEFQQRHAFVRHKMSRYKTPRSPGEANDWVPELDRRELDEWVPDVSVFVQPAMQRIVTVLNEELLQRPRYSAIAIETPIIRGATKCIGETVNTMHRRYLNEFAWEIGAAEPPQPSPATHDAFQRIKSGEVFVLPSAADINDLFLFMQQEMIHTLREQPVGGPMTIDDQQKSFLQPVAALVRSSILGFYQREDGPRPRPTNIANLWKGFIRPKSPLDLDSSYDAKERVGGRDA